MTLKEAKNIRAKIDYTREDGRYAALTPKEVKDYYRFALGGYICGKHKFVYADAQSMAKYIDVLLVNAYLKILEKQEGLKAAKKEYIGIVSLGYMYTFTHNGVNVLCTSEGQNYLQQKVKKVAV